MENYVVYSAENDKFKLEVVRDDNPQDPRDPILNNLGTMVCAHKRYCLGDTPAENTSLYNNWFDWLRGEIFSKYGGIDNVVVMPLYLYDHSGITISTTSFRDRWDSGQVGWIYATKDKFMQMTGYSAQELFSSDAHREPMMNERVKIEDTEEWGLVVDKSTNFVLVDFDYNKSGISTDKKKILVPLTQIKGVMHSQAIRILQDEVNEYDLYLRGETYGCIVYEKFTCKCCGDTKYAELESYYGILGLPSKEDLIDHVGTGLEELLVNYP